MMVAVLQEVKGINSNLLVKASHKAAKMQDEILSLYGENI
jgi:hypothetical protein